MKDALFSTQYWDIALVNEDMYLGRLVIKTKENRVSLPDLTEEEQKDFFMLIKSVEAFFRETLQATMFNYSCLMNHAYRDGENPHVHFHFRPRYKNPITILGHTFTDPNFGEHYISPTLTRQETHPLPEEVRVFITQHLVDYLEQKSA